MATRIYSAGTYFGTYFGWNLFRGSRLISFRLNRRVRAGGTELHLTSLEQSLLYLLAANGGLLTRDEILNYLWGADYVAESNVVDRHIRNLRLKLDIRPGGTP